MIDMYCDILYSAISETVKHFRNLKKSVHFVLASSLEKVSISMISKKSQVVLELLENYLLKFLLVFILLLTHCGLVTPYSDKDLGEHWLR